jgi:hypothetical protein
MTSRPFSIDGLRAHVPNSLSAGTRFEEFGFIVTPQSQLPGLSNRLICFEPHDRRGASFIELLSIEDRRLASSAALDLLGKDFGPTAAILSCDDAVDFAHELEDDRIEPRHITRKWVLPTGTLNVDVTTLNVPRAVSPLGWALMQHRTPEHYRIPEFIQHPNGVKQVRALLAVAPNPNEIAEYFKALWSGEITGTPDRASLRIGFGELRICTPEVLQETFHHTASSLMPHLAGIVLECADPDALEHWMKPRGLLQSGDAGSTYLPAAAALGCILVFVPPDEFP